MNGYTFREKNKINDILSDRPHLEAVYTHTLNIPERVREYDNTLFLVFNNQTTRFEIHSTDTNESYNASVPFRNLDARTIRHIMRNDVRVHGHKIMERLNKSEEKKQKQQAKAEKDHMRDFAKEFQGEFAKDAWLM